MGRALWMGMGARRFEELIAWQLADALRSEIIAFTESGRVAKDFKYRDQIRDAIGSACRNTSEGFGRFKPPSFCQFLEYARASLNETQDCLLEARKKGYLTDDTFAELWRLSKRAIGANTNLWLYLKRCIANGTEPWKTGTIDSEP